MDLLTLLLVWLGGFATGTAAGYFIKALKDDSEEEIDSNPILLVQDRKQNFDSE